MTEPVRAPFPLSKNECRLLRELLRELLARDAFGSRRAELLKRLDEFYPAVDRATEQARHAAALEAIHARPKG